MAQVEIEVVGRDSFSSTLGNIGNIITGIKSAIDLVSDAFRVASEFVGQFVNSASESQQAVFELEAVLRATGGAAGFTSEELQGMADGLQNVTRFSDETILGGQSMLLTFRNIGEETFPRATEAMLDMATMFGSVDTAAVQLGKALNDPIAGIGALQRIGIQFTEEQKTMIENFMETGDVAAAQNVILREVEMQIGGLAIAMGETFAGKVDILKNKFDTLKELIGGPIMIMLTQFLDTFMTGFDNLINSEWPPIIILERLNEYMESGFPLAQALGLSFHDLFELTPEEDAFFDSVSSFFLTLQSALDNGQSGLEAFGTALDFLVRDGGPLSGFAENILSVITAFESGGFLAALDQFVANLFNGIANSIDAWVSGGGPEELSNSLIGWFSDIGTGPEFQSRALVAAGNLLSALGQALSSIDWSGITDAMDAALARIIERHDWQTSGDAFGQAIADMFTFGVTSEIESSGSQAIPAIGQAISEWFRGAVGDVWFEHSLQEIASSLLGILLESIRDGLIDLAVSGHEAWINFWIELFRPDDLPAFDYTFEMGQEMIRGLINGLNSIELGISNWVRDHIITPVKQFLGIASPSSVFMEIGRDVVLGLIQGILSLIGTLPSLMLGVAASIIGGLITGWTAAFGTFLNLVKSSIAGILEIMQPVLDFFNIDFGTTQTGTTGSMPGDTGHTRDGGTTLTGTTTNTFNFYGTVYMSGVGPEGTFDCPSPHPIMIASSQSLLTSGVA